MLRSVGVAAVAALVLLLEADGQVSNPFASWGMAFGPETGCTSGSLFLVTAPGTDSRGRNQFSCR